MSQTKQIFLAFLIPFVSAAGLFFLGVYYIFPNDCVFEEMHHGERICFEYRSEELERIYGLLVMGLFLVSIILPPFITRRDYQKKKAELKAKSIFE